MKRERRSELCRGAALSIGVLVFLACSLAWGGAPPVGLLATPVRLDVLDPAAFRQLADGVESPLPQSDGPRHVIWTTNSETVWDGAAFGDSKTPGPRSLRIGFKAPVAVAAVLVRGGGVVSLLRPEATYPGDMADDAQWITGQRLVDRGASHSQVAPEEYAIWVFPKVIATRALRFTHTAQPTDVKYAGWLGGVYVLSSRVANIAPQATVLTDANQEAAGKLNDENNNDMWKTWDNGPAGGVHVVSREHPVDVVLAWPAAVRVAGLVALWAGFSDAEVQVFQGPPDRPLREASDADWQTVAQWYGVQNQYPRALGSNWLDFGKEYSTRGIRLRITAATQETHPHLQGKTAAGKRVWLGELMALTPLGDAPLEAAVLPSPRSPAGHPPIPVRVHLDKPGRVTLVIENEDGVRVRNLISETPLPAGENTIWWDGTTDLARDLDAPTHGVYRIPAQLAPAGMYRVRGLVHPGIHLHYEFAVYNAGNPAWPTADHTGGWLTNHTPPSSALFVPGDKAPDGQDLVYLGSYVSEGGDGLAWVDLAGHKRGGVGWVGGAWTGAPYLARDAGDRAAANVYVYVGSAWEGELRLTAVTSQGDKPVIKYAVPSNRDVTASALAGLAIHNGLLVCSLRQQNQLLLVDAKAGKVLGAHAVDDPRGLAFDPQGRLLVLTGSQLRRYEPAIAESSARLGHREILIAAGLEDPQHVALDATGNFYVSDRGNSHQVKVFDPQGKPLRTIGKPGTPKTGPYDPEHMNDPNGLTIDSRGRLWVAETNFQPKRVSVWTLDGRLVTACYGPSEYGGGGTLDPVDKTRFYYRGMEFHLDWKAGTDRLTRVFFRADANAYDMPKGHFVDGQPEMPIYAETSSGRRQRYFTNCYDNNPTNGAGIVTLWLDRGDAAVPVAAIGRANDWDLLKSEKFRLRWPQGVEVRGGNFSAPLMFAWTDANGDGRVQAEEVEFIKAGGGGFTVMPDLSVAASWVDGRAMRYAVQGFTASGAPRYDLARGETLAEGAQRPTSSGGDQALTEPSGWTVLTVGPKPFAPQSLGGVFQGKPRWSYPDLWPGLHASHESPPPEQAGELIGTTRLLGGFVTPRRGDAGPLWAINGNMGNIYLFTADGLFVAELFRDIRKGVSWAMPAARRGMLLDDVSLHDENFWPSITQTADGQVYLVDGGRTSLVRVDGLDDIRRLPESSVRLTDNDLRSAQQYLVRSESERQTSQGRPALRVPIRKSAPVVDGKLDDWAAADWATIDRSGVAAFFNSHSKPYDITASVAVAGDRLYAAFRTGDARLLENSGETPLAPFKTGGALDLMIAAAAPPNAERPAPAAGDLRLLVTRVKGKTLAMLYRPVVPGTTKAVAFSSPWRTITIDRVDDISNQVQLAGGDGNYEFSVPLAALGLEPRPGMVLRGDVGILRGNGFQTLHRVYWSNKATAIVSDVPSEAALVPQLWGRWIFVGE